MIAFCLLSALGWIAGAAVLFDPRAAGWVARYLHARSEALTNARREYTARMEAYRVIERSRKGMHP